tara:strand:- start:1003 stop:1455 length:453 start_codon:yes stop_codon:yes gene_type:complete
MTDLVEPLDAKAKLAVSRAQLLAAMGYEQVQRDVTQPAEVAKLPAPRKPARSSISERVSQSLLGRWWRRHPLSTFVELGEPFLHDYASRHPAKLIAYGAGTGALLWILKPWRLLSVATVATLLIKSTDITGFVMDAVKGGSHDQEAEPPN